MAQADRPDERRPVWGGAAAWFSRLVRQAPWGAFGSRL